MRRSLVLPVVAMTALSACATGDQRDYNVAAVPKSTIRTEAPELPPLPQDAVPVPGSKPVAGTTFMTSGPVTVEGFQSTKLDRRNWSG